MDEALRQKFDAWISAVGGIDAAAKRLGCSVALVRSWRNGHRDVTPSWALTIETRSGGRVLRQELVPWLFKGMISEE